MPGGGRKFWALARTRQGTSIKGHDQVNGYLLLATSSDGTLATMANQPPCAVCNNTLTGGPGRYQPCDQGAA